MSYRIVRKIGIGALAILATAGVVSASAQDTTRMVRPLMIQEQGSFAVGGSVMTNSGTYDAINRDPGEHAFPDVGPEQRPDCG